MIYFRVPVAISLHAEHPASHLGRRSGRLKTGCLCEGLAFTLFKRRAAGQVRHRIFDSAQQVAAPSRGEHE
jgi:hypothetical protein